MVTHPSILLIEDSPGQCELFRLALAQTGLDVVLYTEHDADAALHFLNDRVHHSQWSLQARSFTSPERGLNRSPTARTISPAQPSARQDAPFPEGAHSDRAPSASTGDRSGLPPSLPSLILLDLKLGRRNGCDFLIRLRADARLAAIPVVVFTTSDDPTDLSSCYANGANGYVVKPGTFEQLVLCAGDIGRYWINRNLAPYPIGIRC
jgi:CheY-like chemotaxis protein